MRRSIRSLSAVTYSPFSCIIAVVVVAAAGFAVAVAASFPFLLRCIATSTSSSVEIRTLTEIVCCSPPRLVHKKLSFSLCVLQIVPKNCTPNYFVCVYFLFLLLRFPFLFTVLFSFFFLLFSCDKAKRITNSLY